MARRSHGEGTRHKRADGRWEWRVTMPDGRRRSFYGRTEREARDKKNRALREYEQGLRASSEKLTVATYLRSWLDGSLSERARPSTVRSYRQQIEHHLIPALGHIKLRDLEVMHVNAMLADLVAGGLSPQSANVARKVLTTALQSAVKQGLILRNVASLSDPRREDARDVVPYSPEEARALIAATRDDPLGPMIALALATGMRQGELLALQWRSVDLDRRRLRVERTVTRVNNRQTFGPPKTQAGRRTIWLTDVAIDALRRARVVANEYRLLAGGRWVDHDLVFPSRVGTAQYGQNVTARIKRAMERSGVRVVTFHALRHTTASLLLAEGMDVFAVKEMLGHANIQTTLDIYGHMTDRLAGRAAASIDRVLGDDRAVSG